MITAILKVTLHYDQNCLILSKNYDIFFAFRDLSMAKYKYMYP